MELIYMRLLNNKTVYFQIYIIHFELIVYTILKMKHVYIHYYSCNEFTQQSKQKTPVNYELVQTNNGNSTIRNEQCFYQTSET